MCGNTAKIHTLTVHTFKEGGGGIEKSTLSTLAKMCENVMPSLLKKMLKILTPLSKCLEKWNSLQIITTNPLINTEQPLIVIKFILTKCNSNL